ncbi:1,4-dihydroxy-2-naphthoate polyprenyltransferase [Ewingella americana]|uniref:1,4-dihydroxy-2-naphthoate octaprenyltransferase n=2 Tax=Ewingella americana TaxID=41202 RepID=A0A085G3Y9_EWIA3|nr:1,4-dihydroxy-2-naphthoate polyprenyltransferase [Ewingella americana]KAA8725550.1 1,4-dihydroxy-2-naphthoate polyprenyltransferase [Ewingella americana]KFC78434.1 1,4-dihydroxy-2-naphthoate octaprenyltransferase [Ewingella americana ATCC 33852]STQ46973.1 1,4-dihydroxy-2-naphthoate octaprenyltransferase [Ewingella americana]
MSMITPCNTTSPTKAWLESLRLRTLPLAFASIVMGSAVASLQGVFHPLTALLALLTAGLLQILSNLANDYGDAEKGSDTPDRIGPLRGMQKGLINASQMKRAIILTVVLAVLSGIALIAVACQKPSDVVGFLILGLLSIGAAITYTVGTRPYGYMGLGDISVLVFFGWISVAGTFYLQAGYFDWVVMLPATATGLLATAVLNINNLRDIETDSANGKNTLAVRLGPKNARRYHALIISGAVLCLALFALLHLHNGFGWLFILALPLLAKHVLTVMREPTAEGIRPLLENMVKVALLTNVLFAVGLLLN